jgi:O-antigen/teichoic acid export membrane protein
MNIKSEGISKRDKKLNSNIKWSLIIKAIAMLITFLKVPILLTYLDPERYGVWLTIMSILIWTQQFDLGLGAGLRYKLAEAFTQQDHNKAKLLVSTCYISMTVIMTLSFIVVSPLLYMIDWSDFLNVDSIDNSELSKIILITYFTLIFQFILNLIVVILNADQRSAMGSVFLPISNLLSLFSILVILEFSSNSLLYACIAMSLPYVLTLTIATIYLFSTKYKYIRPNIQFFRFSYIKDVYSIGIKNFVGQLSSVVVFGTSNLLISKIIEPEAVTEYNTALTFFNITIVFFTMVLVPSISATTDAYIRGDYDWIKRNMKKINKFAALFSLFSFIMLLLSDFVFEIWTGGKVQVSYELSVSLFIYTVLNVFVSSYNMFLVGVGKLYINMLISIFKMLAFIPFAIASLNEFGVIGIVISIIVINTLPNYIFGSIQYFKIVNRNSEGIWNK